MKEELFSLLANNTGALTLEDIFINFIVSALIAMIIYISYSLSHSGPVYSAKFNTSLVMLALVTTLVMNVIGNNIALSLGMVGALSIVRFRTPIKDPRDTAYIFWSIAVGICCGVSEFVIGAVGSGVIFLFMLIFGFVKSNERYLLVVRAERKASEYIKKAIYSIYGGKVVLRVENTTGATVEYIFELSQKVMNNHKDVSLTEEMYKIEGVNNVNIVCQNDEINR
ncbi:MAG: DUF4956 domain-containing protein [Aminipila sp.]